MNNNTPHALITGISGTIGRALARHWLDNGWEIHGTYLRHDQAVPEGAHGHALDLTKSETLPDQLRDLTDNDLPLRAVVHCAGNLRDHSLPNLSPDDWTSVRQVHLDGAFQLARTLRPCLARSATADFLLVGSRVGQRGGYGQANYAAAKAGLIGFTRSLAREWSPDIQVNLLRPPLTESAMTENQDQDIDADEFIPPEETARWIARLVEGTGVTGQILTVDQRIDGGGW